MTEGALSSIIEYKTSYEVWISLEKLYTTQTKAKVMQLKRQIQNTKKEGISMNDYYIKMNGLVAVVKFPRK